jgi:hypothetical protein
LSSSCPRARRASHPLPRLAISILWRDADLGACFPRRFSDVKVAAPFPLETPAEHYIHTAYLDTLGRPAVRLRKAHCTEQCGTAGPVLVRPDL